MYAPSQTSGLEPPWGDDYACCGGPGVLPSRAMGWIAAHPFLSLLAAIVVVAAISSGGKR